MLAKTAFIKDSVSPRNNVMSGRQAYHGSCCTRANVLPSAHIILYCFLAMASQMRVCLQLRQKGACNRLTQVTKPVGNCRAAAESRIHDECLYVSGYTVSQESSLNPDGDWSNHISMTANTA